MALRGRPQVRRARLPLEGAVPHGRARVPQPGLVGVPQHRRAGCHPPAGQRAVPGARPAARLRHQQPLADLGLPARHRHHRGRRLRRSGGGRAAGRPHRRRHRCGPPRLLVVRSVGDGRDPGAVPHRAHAPARLPLLGSALGRPGRVDGGGRRGGGPHAIGAGGPAPDAGPAAVPRFPGHHPAGRRPLRCRRPVVRGGARTVGRVEPGALRPPGHPGHRDRHLPRVRPVRRHLVRREHRLLERVLRSGDPQGPEEPVRR